MINHWFNVKLGMNVNDSYAVEYVIVVAPSIKSLPERMTLTGFVNVMNLCFTVIILAVDREDINGSWISTAAVVAPTKTTLIPSATV